MIFAKEITELKERVAELETENAELKYVEEWKMLAEGIHYRKVRNRCRVKNTALGRCRAQIVD